jgi:hypothetical protein
VHGQPVRAVVAAIGLPPGDLCKVIAGQSLSRQPLNTYWALARWLQMPLSNVVALAGKRPRLAELVALGMVASEYVPTNAQHQVAAAEAIGISVAVLRRALHGYADFRPSIRTCDLLAAWLSWTGYTTEEIATAAGMGIRYRTNGRALTTTLALGPQVGPYPCACGRPGCLVPAHLPVGPRRIWRSDACRMWAKRQLRRAADPRRSQTPLPYREPIVRFIRINERAVPARF